MLADFDQLVAPHPEPSAADEARLTDIAGLSRVTIEALTCPGEH